MSKVNWEEQWALFAPHFRNGRAEIPIRNQTLKLKPGPGFGDLSHPTTALMLQMMEDRIDSEPVVDIGCGSGILSLAALLLGATAAVGIDIEPDAIAHATENARLNQLPAQFGLTLASIQPSIFLMNMILPEQRDFHPERYNTLAKLWITSGILLEQKEEYLRQTATWGWRLLALHSQKHWLGGVFTAM